MPRWTRSQSGAIYTPDPVAWEHPLNRGLVGWWLPLPHLSGGSTLYNLALPCHASIAGTWATVLPTGYPSLQIPNGTIYNAPNSNDVYSFAGSSGKAPYSASAWIYVPTSVAVSAHIISSGNALGTGFWGFQSANLSIQSYRVSSTGTTTLCSSTFTAAQWLLFCVTWDGSTLRNYLNGLASTTAASSVVTTTGNANLQFGHNAGSSYVRLSDARIWNRTLSATEIAAVYQDSRQGYPDTLRRTRSSVVFYLPASIGSLSLTLGSATLTGTATSTPPTPTTGGLTLTLASLVTTATASATVPTPTSGGLTVTLASLGVAGTATAAGPAPTTASLATTLASLSVTARATAATPAPSSGLLTITLAGVSTSATATATVPPPTSASLSKTLGNLTLAGAGIGNHISFEQSLVAELTAIPALTSLAGNRIYESILPQKSALPALVYHTGQEIGPIWLTGQSSIRSETVTFDLLSLSKSTTRALQDAIEDHFVMADYRGNLGGGVYVAETILDSVDTSYVRLADGTDRAVRLATVTLKMRYAIQ